jgi:hypothetical protein
LLADGPQRDVRAALKHHMDAVQAATPLASDANAAVRRAAKDVLVDANLGAANDIAWGSWKKQEVVVPKWLSQAATAADDLAINEAAGLEPRFRVARRSLSALAALKGQIDESAAVRAIQQIGPQLLAVSADEDFQRRVAWDTAVALHDALQIAHDRGRGEPALAYSQSALAILAREQPDLRRIDGCDRLIGQICFRTGLIHAVLAQDHRQAAIWYARAIPLLEKPAPPAAVGDPAQHGEAFISMGVSYWQLGQRQKALELTSEGVHLFEQAVEAGHADEAQLEIPYANLANMHRQLGNTEASKQYADLASRIKQDAQRK